MEQNAHINNIPAILNENRKALTNLDTHGISVSVNELSHSIYLDLRYSSNFSDVSPCGRFLLINYRNSVRLWEIDKDQIFRIFNHHSDINSAQFSPDGKLVLAGGKDRSVSIWEIDSGKQINSLNPKDDYEYLFSKFIFHFNIAGQCDFILVDIHFNNNRPSMIEIWSYPDGKIRKINNAKLAGKGENALSPDGRYFLNEMNDEEKVILWDVETLEIVKTIEIKSVNKLNALCFSPDGKYFSTAADKAIIWEFETGKPMRTFEIEGCRIYRAIFSPDGKTLLTTTPLEHIGILWDIQTGKQLANIRKKGLEFNKALFCRGQDQIILYWYVGHKPIYVWDLKSAGITAKYDKPGTTQRLEGLRFSKREPSFFIGGGDTIDEIDLFTGTVKKKFGPKREGKVSLSIISPNGKFVIVQTEKNKNRLLIDTQTGKTIADFDGVSVETWALSFSPDSRNLAIGYKDGRIAFWSIENGKIINEYQIGTRGVATLTFSPCGNFIFVVDKDKQVQIFEVDTGKKKHSINCNWDYDEISVSDMIKINWSISLLEISSDGQIIFIAGWPAVKLIDSTSYRVIKSFPEDTSLLRAIGSELNQSHALNPSGNKVLLCQYNSGSVILFDIKKDNVVQTFNIVNEKTKAAYFVPNSRLIATRHDIANTICFWDMDSGELLVTFYYLKDGFLWATPPDGVAKSGWFWTNRSEVLTVFRVNSQSGISVLGQADEKRETYIETYNRQDIVMSRLNNFEAYQKEINRILSLRKQKENLTLIEMKLNHVRQIEQNAR